MCTLSFHRHFNYYKSATRARDSVTIISLIRASDWSLWPLHRPLIGWSLITRGSVITGTRTEVTRVLSSDCLVPSINISISALSWVSPSPAETLGLLTSSLGSSWLTEHYGHGDIHEMHRQMEFFTDFWLQFTLRRLQNIDTGLVSSNGYYQCHRGVLWKLDNPSLFCEWTYFANYR